MSKESQATSHFISRLIEVLLFMPGTGSPVILTTQKPILNSSKPLSDHFLLFYFSRVPSHKITEIRRKQSNILAWIGFCDVSVTSACNPVMLSGEKSLSFSSSTEHQVEPLNNSTVCLQPSTCHSGLYCR